jgi:hypothetical protein
MDVFLLAERVSGQIPGNSLKPGVHRAFGRIETHRLPHDDDGGVLQDVFRKMGIPNHALEIPEQNGAEAREMPNKLFLSIFLPLIHRHSLHDMLFPFHGCAIFPWNFDAS